MLLKTNFWITPPFSFRIYVLVIVVKHLKPFIISACHKGNYCMVSSSFRYITLSEPQFLSSVYADISLCFPSGCPQW